MYSRRRKFLRTESFSMNFRAIISFPKIIAGLSFEHKKNKKNYNLIAMLLRNFEVTFHGLKR